MQIRWHGQSAFTLAAGSTTVVIDPFDADALRARVSYRFDYPPIPPQRADLLLVTHEHPDHNATGLVEAEHVIRSTAGRFEKPLGEVVAVASEHDPEAGTRRGPNTLFVRVCHLGDLGQPALRPEQAAALGQVELLMIPVGGGPTIGAEEAAGIVEALRPRWVVPMHYRSAAVGFLEPADAFLARFADVRRFDGPEFSLPPAEGPSPTILVPAPPVHAR
jgi:L-ascorbate metabolism protein UlaG (beta-lactamase superfamily)